MIVGIIGVVIFFGILGIMEATGHSNEDRITQLENKVTDLETVIKRLDK